MSSGKFNVQVLLTSQSAGNTVAAICGIQDDCILAKAYRRCSSQSMSLRHGRGTHRWAYCSVMNPAPSRSLAAAEDRLQVVQRRPECLLTCTCSTSTASCLGLSHPTGGLHWVDVVTWPRISLGLIIVLSRGAGKLQDQLSCWLEWAVWLHPQVAASQRASFRHILPWL